MTTETTSDKLAKLIRDNAEEMAEKWLKDINKNTKTPTYHEFVDKKLFTRVVEVYSSLEKCIAQEADVNHLITEFTNHGAERCGQGFKISEVVQALILMRHHLWQKVMAEGLLDNALDYYHAAELYRKVVRYFDQAIYFTIVGYERAKS